MAYRCLKPLSQFAAARIALVGDENSVGVFLTFSFLRFFNVFVQRFFYVFEIVHERFLNVFVQRFFNVFRYWPPVLNVF